MAERYRLELDLPSRTETFFCERLQSVAPAGSSNKPCAVPPHGPEDGLSGATRTQVRIPLRQVGYEGLLGPALSQGRQWVVGQVSDGYVLSAGDQLLVAVRGTSLTLNERVAIDRAGMLALSTLAPIPAAGRTLAELHESLRAEVRRIYRDAEVFVSLEQMRSIGVLVSGAVNKPGLKSLPGVASVIDALIAAGGVRKEGSLRRIQVVRDGTTMVDLYPTLLGAGVPSFVRLRDGDRIVVPALTEAVAVAGDVRRPGVFEAIPGEPMSIQALLELAGGTLAGVAPEIMVLRAGADVAEAVAVPLAADIALENGSLLVVRTGGAGASQGVLLDGAVVGAGRYPVDPRGATIVSLLRDGARLKEGAYLPMAVVGRWDARSRRRVPEPVNLVAQLQGEADPVWLFSGDDLIVLSRADLAYVTGEDVQALLRGDVPPSVLRALRVLISGEEANRNAVAGQQVQPQTVMQDASAEQQTPYDMAIGRPVSRADIAAAWNSDDVCDALPQVAQSLADLTVPTPFAVQDINDTQLTGVQDAVPCSSVFERHPWLMPFMLDRMVRLEGGLVRPGPYPVTGPTSLADLVMAAGGLSKGVDLSRVEVARAGAKSNQIGDPSRQSFDATALPLASIMLAAGDTARFNRVREQVTGYVTIEGEVANPGTYTLRDGDTLLTVLMRAGGLTREAYPLGALFMRVSVAERQRSILRRAASQFRSAVASALGQDTLEGGQAQAISQLFAEFDRVAESSEGLGRMVVEANPTVLQVSPELDTLLENRDRIVIPQRPQHVLVAGEVINPTSIRHGAGMVPSDYISLAGGLTDAADSGQAYIILPNGEADSISLSRWSFSTRPIPPGSSLVVPRDPAPFNTNRFLREAFSVLSQASVTVASLTVIGRD